MALPSISDQLLEKLERLGSDDQHRVLDFARALTEASPKGTPGHELVQFSGTLDPEHADEIRAAIEEGCERVDPDEW